METVVDLHQRNRRLFFVSKMLPIEPSEYSYHWCVWSVFRRNFEESLITETDCRAVKDISIRGGEGYTTDSQSRLWKEREMDGVANE